MNSTAIQEIELSIKESQGQVALGTALERLKANKDFKLLVTEGYFNQEAIRLVHLKADPAMQTPASQAAILTQIDAIGALHQYFQTVAHRAHLAKKAIADGEEMRDELLTEEARK